jgi:hypothetical protein
MSKGMNNIKIENDGIRYSNVEKGYTLHRQQHTSFERIKITTTGNLITRTKQIREDKHELYDIIFKLPYYQQKDTNSMKHYVCL